MVTERLSRKRPLSRTRGTSDWSPVPLFVPTFQCTCVLLKCKYGCRIGPFESLPFPRIFRVKRNKRILSVFQKRKQTCWERQVERTASFSGRTCWCAVLIRNRIRGWSWADILISWYSLRSSTGRVRSQQYLDSFLLQFELLVRDQLTYSRSLLDNIGCIQS